MLKAITLAKFCSKEIEADELKKMISEVVSETYPDCTVELIKINHEGMIDVLLSNGNQIEIEVDWNEIILR